METIIQILIAFLLAFMGVADSPGEAPAAPPPVVTELPPDLPELPMDEPTMQVWTGINSVEILVQESFPMQIQLQVQGFHDGCEYPVQSSQTRSGNTVTVEVFRKMPLAVACPMIALPFEMTIPLNGAFEPGSYTINVNDQTYYIDL